MHDYLIQNIPAEQNIFSYLNSGKLEIVFHNEFISLFQVHQIDFK